MLKPLREEDSQQPEGILHEVPGGPDQQVVPEHPDVGAQPRVRAALPLVAVQGAYEVRRPDLSLRGGGQKGIRDYFLQQVVP